MYLHDLPDPLVAEAVVLGDDGGDEELVPDERGGGADLAGLHVDLDGAGLSRRQAGHARADSVLVGRGRLYLEGDRRLGDVGGAHHAHQVALVVLVKHDLLRRVESQERLAGGAALGADAVVDWKITRKSFAERKK